MFYVHTNNFNHPENCTIEAHKESTNVNLSTFKIFGYCMIWLISVALLFVYILFQFIPENNIFAMNIPVKHLGDYVHILFPLMYSLASKYALPFFIKKMKLHSKYESFIFILTTILFTFFLPIMFCFILSNHCLNVWVIFGNLVEIIYLKLDKN